MATENKAEKTPRTTPYTSFYVTISSTSEQTRGVLKDIGAKFIGGDINKWAVDKDAYDASIDRVNAAYADDAAARAEKAAVNPSADQDGSTKTPRTTPYTSFYVTISSTSEQTRSVLKDLGAKFIGGDVGKWTIDRDAYEGAIDRVNTAYAADAAARAENAASKPAKEPKAPKPDLTEEEKAAKAEAARAAALERDATRVPVLAGSVAVEGGVTVQGVEVAVTKLGKAWTLDEAGVKDLAGRFPDVSFNVGDEVTYASFDAEELKVKLEDTPAPSM